MDRVNVFWFRDDLRLEDHELLQCCSSENLPVLGIYILTPALPWKRESAGAWWLHHALLRFKMILEKAGGRLHVFSTDAVSAIEQIENNYSIHRIYASYSAHLPLRKEDESLQKHLKGKETELVQTHQGKILNPDFIRTGAGDIYKVFTPFYKKCRPQLEEEAINQVLKPRISWLKDHKFETYESQLLPKILWYEEMHHFWKPEENFEKRLQEFCEHRALFYEEKRDILAFPGTSELSPYLAFGELSPLRVIRELKKQYELKLVEPYVRQLYWKEFCYYLLWHYPYLGEEPLRQEWKEFPWKYDEDLFSKWRSGNTGIPVVDAAMKQLWRIGWMHNRCRMIVASLLVKQLLIPWQYGERWFADTLVDFEPANNSFGWQWASGCGADAAPYFRVFNPVTQGKKFDPEGDYLKQWNGSAEPLLKKGFHEPWKSGGALPVILPEDGRAQALFAYDCFKNQQTEKEKK
jgi:deoxyribodipyrimidine photo-lyase